MSLTKVTYVNGETVIYADNLNAIQDELILLKNDIDEEVEAREEAVRDLKSALAPTIPANLAEGCSFTNGKAVLSTTGQIPSVSVYAATSYIDVSGCSEIIYTRMCDLSGGAPVIGMAFYAADKTYISGVPIERVYSAAMTKWYKTAVPDTAQYARFTYWRTEYQVLPFCVYDAAQYNRAKIIREITAVRESLEDRKGLAVSDWISSSCILSTYYEAGTLKQGVLTTASSALKASAFVPVSGKMLELPIPIVSDTTYPNYGFSLFDENQEPIPGRAISAIPNRSGDTYVAWIRVYLPENAKYFRTTYWDDTYVAITQGYAPAFSYNLLKDIPDEFKPITHELPVDTYMQHAIRRARQLTDIKWTPRVKIPRYSMLNGGSDHFLDWFYQDKEYTGIPYSGSGKGEVGVSWTSPAEWGYAHMWVGACVPFESFVTAARYPNSIFGETVTQSAPDYDSSPFGIVCTALVNYAVNGPWPLRAIRNFFDTSDDVFRKPVSENTIAELDANDIMIGDFLYTALHVIIITDLLRDGSGNVTHVELSEATTVGNGNNTVLGTKFGGVARRKMWEYAEFKARYGAYVKYRRTTFFGIPYVASKYVNTGNEGDRENVQDLACIPYLGSGAVYREGYIHNSKILIGATGFTSLVVLKDGESFGTFAIEGLSEISVGFSEVGSYEAYLTNGSTRTMSCTWTVASGVM